MFSLTEQQGLGPRVVRRTKELERSGMSYDDAFQQARLEAKGTAEVHDPQKKYSLPIVVALLEQLADVEENHPDLVEGARAALKAQANSTAKADADGDGVPDVVDKETEAAANLPRAATVLAELEDRRHQLASELVREARAIVAEGRGA